jgi:hypothetical protein
MDWHYERCHLPNDGQQQQTNSRPIYEKLAYHSSTNDTTINTNLTPFSLSPMTDTAVDSLPALFLAYCIIVDTNNMVSIDSRVAPQALASDPVPLLTDWLCLEHRPWTLPPCLLIDYTSAFGLGHTPSPSRSKDDDPLVHIIRHVPKPPCTLWGALSSTLSSNHHCSNPLDKMSVSLCTTTPQSYWLLNTQEHQQVCCFTAET